VFWDRRCNKWFAQIVKNGKQLYLGIQDSEIEAARAYNTAAIELFGQFAFLNSIPTEVCNDNGSESPASGAGNASRESAMA
jgi:hypothetical protein